MTEQLPFNDTDSKKPTPFKNTTVIVLCLSWVIFQIWYASPFPFMISFGIFNETEARYFHLAFAISLAFLIFPSKPISQKIPFLDWILAFVGAYCALYMVIYYTDLSARLGAPILMDKIIAGTGLVLLLEATRRCLGYPLMIIASLFIVYSLFGQYMPDIIAHKGASFEKLMSHQWITTEGVFGVALGVSTSFVFLFVLFGSLLEKSGAGEYFIRVSYALLGDKIGGPAKAAVASSCLSGMISGSSIANVVTTGTFTIPLMKKVGYKPHKAAAIEVASSTNGQLTPPVMGAAAFLMVEYVGISYLEVIKHALLPALISYLALFYIVHLEAKKAGLSPLQRDEKPSVSRRLLNFTASFLVVVLLAAGVYFGLGWIKTVAGNYASLIILGLLLTAYLILVKVASSTKVETNLFESEITKIPQALPTFLSGVYYLLPIVVMLWFLIVERFSPGLSAFYSVGFMTFIVITRKPLQAFFRKHPINLGIYKEGFEDLYKGSVSGARNMIGIGIATATAGIVVGSVTLTGIGLVMTELVEFLSFGNLFLMLFFTAIICLILGMGLPTTANYIVVSTLLAPVIVTLGSQSGLVVPLIAVHMFVFYFGILADDTPPVGLAAYAASAISKSDPITTGIQGFIYDIRTAILPFMFIFNTKLLLIGLESIWDGFITVFSSVMAMLVFSIATQKFWYVKLKLYEVILLLIVCFTFFRPDFWLDQVSPKFNSLPPKEIYQVLEEEEYDGRTLIHVSGLDLEGTEKKITVPIPKGYTGTAEQKLADFGVVFKQSEDKLIVDRLEFGSQAERAGMDFDWTLNRVLVPNSRFPAEIFYFPAFFILLFIAFKQRRQLKRNNSA